MKSLPTCVIALIVTLVPFGVAAARPADPALSAPRFHVLTPGESGSKGNGLMPLSSGIVFDTTWYGGSVWAADSNRWEALRGPSGTLARWTFDTGVGSNYTETLRSPKPVGWHHRMEGWYGIDQTFNPLPWFRRSTTCVLNGAYSMWAGVTLAESDPLCYAAGQGYGNSWNMTVSKTLNYAGSGSATLSYRYRTECEPSFDYLYVTIDTSGTGATDDVLLNQYTGTNGPATATVALTRGATLRSTPGPITIKFNATSDGAYSDEDGSYPTSCGHSTVDDIRLTGALVDFSDFEAGSNGWALEVPASGPGGDWSDIRSLATLPPILSFCPCSMSDSVLVFADLTGGHSTQVDNIAASPWIDLKAGGDVGRPGRILRFEGYFNVPLTNYIFVQQLVSWYPAICPQTGRVYTKPFTSDGFFNGWSFSVPSCVTSNFPVQTEFSAVIPPSAEQVRVAVGVLSYCALFANCTGLSDANPYFDNISFGVYGALNAPIVNLRTIDVFQDNFAADGTLNPGSTGRVDCNDIKGATNPVPYSALGDTLIVNGDGGNTEVRVVFKVRPGPFTNASALAAWAGAKWTNEPALGPGWYSARMDTGEQGGTKTSAKWMGTLHESDPKFGGGTDTDKGGEGDAGQLSHDIFPDHIFTPGSRIDYFVQSRFIPPDPRNPGGAFWYVTPDTTGGRTLEVEILPSSMAADTTWNCTLYVDHHADRDPQSQHIEELGLANVLGGGGNNRESTRFDRYDVQAPSSQQASLGRPLHTQYGATATQLFAYRAVAWHSGVLASFNLVDEDANILAAWLTEPSTSGHRFWASGDGLARGIASEGEPTTQSFLRDVCGVVFTCDTIRLASCPSGSVQDSTYCLPLANVTGAWFGSGMPVNARGNGCPEIRSYDLLGANAAVPSAKGQLAYVKTNGVQNYASVTNYNTAGVDYKTVIDGVGVGVLRDPHGSTHNAARCDIQTPAIARAGNIFSWFLAPNTFSICRTPAGLSDADPGDGAPRPPAWRTHLEYARPNPVTESTRIRFTTAREGERVRLDLFDVTGRLVRTLQNGALPVGAHEVGWDGRDADGARVAAGLYFARLAAGDVRESRKLLVTR